MHRSWIAAYLLFATGVRAQAPDPPKLPKLHESIVVRGTAVEPSIDRRNSEVFTRALFTRDDQVLQVLDAGINAGQHEGGGKSLEIRRFGFNLDHGGVSGGLKVLVDGIQQNQATQGHGQGYLGNLKSLTPELVQEVNLINGPFSAEYGDFSGLGVVHIILRESLPNLLTLRLQGGSFDSCRGFLGYSPQWKNTDAVLGYEGSFSNGPFLAPLGYRRDNLTGNITARRGDRKFGFKYNYGRNESSSSGQIPLDEVAAGRLDRFGFVDPTHGVKAWNGTAALYFRQEGERGAVLKADAFAGRSLFDLFSNFTYFLNDPDNGDAIQQHDSRLQQGANFQYLRPHRVLGAQGYLSAGANYHDNQINVGLYPRAGRVPTGVAARANARVHNGAGFVQENLSLLAGRLILGGGLRYDVFRFRVTDRLDPARGGTETAGRWQPKASVAFTPLRRLPAVLHFNYGRGISTADARVVVQRLESERIATTDFFQAGASHDFSRLSLSESFFFIRRSNEQVYVPDDGTVEFRGPSRSAGFEVKASYQVTRRVALNGGLTKVSNAYFRATDPREYLTNAPRFTASAGATVTAWSGWSGSLRLRAINSYRLDGFDPSIRAAGNTVFDLGVTRRLARGVELQVAVDNLFDRDYYETQNFFESRLAGQDPVARIHGTPGYGRTIVAGLTVRLGGK
jgi:outer membrane receptor protein involved in Fe transport